jgi:hypothetical protein
MRMWIGNDKPRLCPRNSDKENTVNNHPHFVQVEIYLHPSGSPNGKDGLRFLHYGDFDRVAYKTVETHVKTSTLGDTH